ncbi:MAG: methyl-accepting chemotaxis protein [Defluviitaleaceae bacterium]|nr:methyl-accepting chemotaxis protein [Defluviitaleaceae bacterium]
MKLLTKLVLSIFITSVVGLTIAFLVFNTFVRNAVHNNIIESTQHNMTIYANELDSWFVNSLYITDSMAAAMSSFNREYMHYIAVNFVNEYPFLEMAYAGFGIDGTFDSCTIRETSVGWILQDRPWYQQAVAARGRAVFTGPYVSAAYPHNLVVSIVRHMPNWYGAVIGVDINMADITSMLAGFDVPGGGYLIVLDESGYIVHHPHSNFAPYVDSADPRDSYLRNISEFQVYAPLNDIIHIDRGFTSFTNFAGVRSYMMAFNMGSTGWTLVSVMPTTVTSGPVWQILHMNMITFSVVMIMVFAFVLLVIIPRLLGSTVTQINNRISDFREYTTAVAKGQYPNNQFNPSEAYADSSFGLDKITTEFDANMRAVLNLIQDMTNMHREQTLGNYKFRLNSSRYDGAYAEVIHNLNEVVDDLTNSRTEILECISKIVDGDFAATLRQFPGDEAYINQAIEGLRSNINSIADAILKVSSHAQSGDIHYRLDEGGYQGQWKSVVSGLNATLQNIDRPFVVIGDVMQNMRNGQFTSQRLQKNALEGVFKDMINTLDETTHDISSYISEIDATLASIADGNLNIKIHREYVGAFNAIKQSVNTILEQLNTTMKDIATVAYGISGGASMLTQTSTALADGVSQQMISLDNLTQIIGDVDSQSKDNATNSQKAADLAKTSRSNAETGNEEMKLLLSSMEQINTSSDKISKINKTIEDIAFQTNLLALNASVEAARAGDHGKGFTVVAEEVRNLAARSSEAAKETDELIQQSIASIREGMTRANDTAASLEKIVSNVVDVEDVVGDIYKSSMHQTEAISEINSGLVQISGVIQSGAATSQETAAAAIELDTQVKILKEKLSFFRTDDCK